MACDVGCAVAGVFGCAVVALDGPLALGLVLAFEEAGPTPLTGRRRPGASATLSDPYAAYAPPVTNTTPSTLAAPMTMTLLDISLTSIPLSCPGPGRCSDCLSAV